MSLPVWDAGWGFAAKAGSASVVKITVAMASERRNLNIINNYITSYFFLVTFLFYLESYFLGVLFFFGFDSLASLTLSRSRPESLTEAVVSTASAFGSTEATSTDFSGV